METLTNILTTIEGVVWGPLMLLLLLGVGLYLQLGLKLLPIRKLGMGFKLLWAVAARPQAMRRKARCRPSTR
ncbi:hypothetical protein A8U91_00801 [Halomonas elongata]|uniref:Sodium:alanine symporter family protein n=1 Tax=Halomonas elongata TaxID=2746 RepID=A0A1B8P2J6_HALEL|nr:hypothetical protein A8U91_00801 [Halomonas elongata]